MPQFLKKFTERESIIVMTALVLFVCQRLGVVVDHDRATSIAANIVELGAFAAYIWSRAHIKAADIHAGAAVAQAEIVSTPITYPVPSSVN